MSNFIEAICIRINSWINESSIESYMMQVMLTCGFWPVAYSTVLEQQPESHKSNRFFGCRLVRYSKAQHQPGLWSIRLQLMITIMITIIRHYNYRLRL